jgi:hypothetical protein
MKLFKNVFGVKIENKPFFQTCLNTWRIARYENGKLERVYENKKFKTYTDCLRECNLKKI